MQLKLVTTHPYTGLPPYKVFTKLSTIVAKTVGLGLLPADKLITTLKKLFKLRQMIH